VTGRRRRAGAATPALPSDQAEDRPSLRARVFLLLDGGGGLGPWSRATGWVLVGLIMLSVLAMALETVADLPAWLRATAWAVQIACVIVFSIEYALRLWTAVEERSRAYRHPVWGRLRWAVTPMALVDLLAVLPFWLGFLIPADLMVLRLFRVFWLLKVTRFSPALTSLGAVVRAEGRALFGVIMLMLIAVIVVSTLMYLIERDEQPDVFSSIPAALWWGVVTLTTVGYGDVVPSSDLGRAFGILVMLSGIGLFALPAAILAAGFVREVRRHDFVTGVDRLMQVPLFAELDPVTVSRLAGLMQPRVLPPRYTVIRRGEPADALYLIVEGQVEVDLPHGIIDLGSGDFFGEQALLSGTDRRNATVSTISDCRLLMLGAADFHQIADQSPKLRERLADLAAERQAIHPLSPQTEEEDGHDAEDGAKDAAATQDGKRSSPR
jgi:voltage-gated potassium channel